MEQALSSSFVGWLSGTSGSAGCLLELLKLFVFYYQPCIVSDQAA
jgi:hypothetical protein